MNGEIWYHVYTNSLDKPNFGFAVRHTEHGWVIVKHPKGLYNFPAKDYKEIADNAGWIIVKISK